MQKTVLSTNEDGTIIYQKLTPKYLDQTCLVTRQTLFTSGNVCRTIGVPEDPQALSELDQITIEAAKDGITLIAIDKNSDKVVGMSVNKFLTKSQPFFETFRSSFKNLKSRQVVEFIITTDSICDVFEHCHIDCVMEILFLGTLPEYRQKGIAKKLCELSVDLAQDLRDGINVKESIHGGTLDLEPVPQAVYAMFTSPISQKIGKELGFELAAQRTLSNLVLLGQVIENKNVQTPVCVEYKLLQKRNIE